MDWTVFKMDLRARIANFRDIDRLSALSAEYKLNTYSDIIDQSKISRITNETEMKYVSSLVKSTKSDIIVLEDKELLVGMIGVTQLRYKNAVPSSITGEITSLYLKKEYRGKGANALLMEAASDWFHQKAMENVVAMVLAKNVPAQIFFLKNGAEIVGVKKSDGIWAGQLIVLFGIFGFSSVSRGNCTDADGGAADREL